MALRTAAEPTIELRETVEGWLPKVGVQFELPNRLEEFEWYGRGETETYPRPQAGGPVGRYAGTVEDQYVPYLPPTDNGNGTDTRWAALTDVDVGLLGVTAEGTEFRVDLRLFSVGESDPMDRSRRTIAAPDEDE